MTPFSALVTPSAVTFTAPDGKSHTVLASDAETFEAVKAKVKEIQAADSDETMAVLHQELVQIVEAVANKINAAGLGKVTVEAGVVYYEGEPVHSVLAERIIWGLDEGFDMTPYIAFLNNLMENPSKQSVQEIFSFIEASKMGITEDGHILGYKRVRNNFHDIHSGKFDNSPGQVVEMRRNAVNDDRTQTCSTGLHFCAMSYLPSFGAGEGNKIVIVKVNPRDIVSVPVDYSFAKARACRYEVVAEYEGTDKDDLLATRPVWSDSDWVDSDDEEEEDTGTYEVEDDTFNDDLNDWGH